MLLGRVGQDLAHRGVVAADHLLRDLEGAGEQRERLLVLLHRPAQPAQQHQGAAGVTVVGTVKRDEGIERLLVVRRGLLVLAQDVLRLGERQKRQRDCLVPLAEQPLSNRQRGGVVTRGLVELPQLDRELGDGVVVPGDLLMRLPQRLHAQAKRFPSVDQSLGLAARLDRLQQLGLAIGQLGGHSALGRGAPAPTGRRAQSHQSDQDEDAHGCLLYETKVATSGARFSRNRRARAVLFAEWQPRRGGESAAPTPR
jgi:hypothetical protein